jgi:competence protein ComEC
MTAVEPLATLDVAFQLSFAATGGLLLLTPRLQTALEVAVDRAGVKWLPQSVAATVAMTVAASLAVAPITAANFERVSLVAVPANVLAAFLFEATIITAAAVAAMGIVYQPLADAVSVLCLVPVSLLITVARAFGSIPGASLAVTGVGLEVAAGFYAVLATATWVITSRPAMPPTAEPARRVPWAFSAAVLVVAAAAFVWSPVLFESPNRLRVTVLDVGQGDAILIETPSGHRILVDGGPSPSALLNALGEVLPAGSRRIDLVVLTHPQEDHVGGLPGVSERYDVRAAAFNGSGRELPSYRAWLDGLEADGTALTVLSAGQIARAGVVTIEVLGPPSRSIGGGADDPNNNSVVLRVTYGDISFLLTGDLAFEGEDSLLGSFGDLRATVLKVGHHGSDGSSGADFLAAVSPEIAVISAGAGNGFGHPSPTTLLRLRDTPIFRTDRNGNVRFETDGKRLYVKPARGSYQAIPQAADR